MTYSNDAQQDDGLSYQEKSIIVSLAGSILVYALFSVLVWQRYQAGGFSSVTVSQFFLQQNSGVMVGEATDFDSATVFQFWGRAVLILIAVQIVLAIIGQIVLAIVHTVAKKEEEIPTFEDERDQLIDLKATRNTFYVVGIGFVLSMILLAVGVAPVVMPIIMLVAMMAAEILGSLSKLYYYRRGF